MRLRMYACFGEVGRMAAAAADCHTVIAGGCQERGEATVYHHLLDIALLLLLEIAILLVIPVDEWVWA